MKAKSEILLGNGAIARGIVESGCHVVTSYPGTPSSEILPEVARFKKELDLPIYVEWSTNEKVAFDVALAASMTGKRSAVAMKQVGLNVAADSLMSSAYMGVIGGMVIITADDPGPHSSQTEQDTRLFALFAKVPVLDPSDPREAKEMIPKAFELSEKHSTPVIVRPAIRVCHAKAEIEFGEIEEIERKADFKKDPFRWAATPVHRLTLHKELNRKLNRITRELEERTDLNDSTGPDGKARLGIIASGIPYATAIDILKEKGFADTIPVLKIGSPFPLPLKMVDEFLSRVVAALVLEETNYTIELQIRSRNKIRGRFTGHVPMEGELIPEKIYSILSKTVAETGLSDPFESPGTRLQEIRKDLELPPRPPTLCPGCPHRAAFFAIRRAFPKGIYPSDIGCYTLGLNMKAVDTCLDMGGAVTLSGGFVKAYEQDGKEQPVIATIGDSTFYHAGIPGLVNAVYNDARFILVVLDNNIVAMTGMQPTPGSGVRADGSQGKSLPLERVIEGCGVDWIRIKSPYEIEEFIDLLKKAYDYTRKPDGGVAVVIARHPCVINDRKYLEENQVVVEISEDCDACGVCLRDFECPALILDEAKERVVIDRRICVNCGLCVFVCPFDRIKEKKEK